MRERIQMPVHGRRARASFTNRCASIYLKIDDRVYKLQRGIYNQRNVLFDSRNFVDIIQANL